MELVVRSTVIFFFLFAITRGLGRKELAQLSAFDLILFVIMGDIVQQGITQEDMSLTGNALAVATIAAWILVFSYANYRFPRLRPALEGEPLVVVKNGDILDKVIARERISSSELMAEARLQGIGDLRSVKFGILETDGKFSFIQDPDFDSSGGDASGGDASGQQGARGTAAEPGQ